MMRESQAAVPQPDRVVFDTNDYELPVLGLCAWCVASVGTNSNNGARVSSRQPEGTRAAGVLGCVVVTPVGNMIQVAPNMIVPVQPEFVADLARLLGPHTRWTDEVGAPLPMYAVTVALGTLCCATHAAWKLNEARK